MVAAPPVGLVVAVTVADAFAPGRDIDALAGYHSKNTGAGILGPISRRTVE